MQVEIFKFQEFQDVRTFIADTGEPWFAATDIAAALGYVNSRKAVSDHCLPKGVTKRDTLSEGGPQETSFINEGNLYRLIIKSNKPEAAVFEQWVMDTVLPTIRKTGKYNHADYLKEKERADRLDAVIEKNEKAYAWADDFQHNRLPDLERDLRSLQEALKTVQQELDARKSGNRDKAYENVEAKFAASVQHNLNERDNKIRYYVALLRPGMGDTLLKGVVEKLDELLGK